MIVSQEHIAERLGLSQRAVSMALSGHRGVSETTRQKVVEAAGRLGYRPHSFARSTLNGRTGCFALVLSTDSPSSMLPALMLAGMQQAVEAENRHLIVATLPDEKLTATGFVPKILRELAADGLLINYNAHIPQRMIELIERHEIPAVWLNVRREFDCAFPDDEQAGLLATEKLIARGHRRIAYVDYNNDLDDLGAHYSAKDRQAGYARAMLAAGLAPRRIGQKRIALARNMMADLRQALEGSDRPTNRPTNRPTALICYSARDSRAAYLVASELRLKVPGELSILRFGSGPFDDFNVDFDVAVIPESDVGRSAARMLTARLTTGQPQLSVSLPFRFHQGQTIASPEIPFVSSSLEASS